MGRVLIGKVSKLGSFLAYVSLLSSVSPRYLTVFVQNSTSYLDLDFLVKFAVLLSEGYCLRF